VQTSACWDNAQLQVLPKGDQEFARQGHNADAANATAAVCKTVLIPVAQGAVGLVTEPGPGDLNGHGSNGAVASLADTLFVGTVATLVGRWRQAGERTQFTPVAETTLGEELHHVQPG
jgi:hypothetical protein